MVTIGTHKEKITPRSYLAECAGRTCHQNRRYLRSTHGKQPMYTQHVPNNEDPESENDKLEA